MLGGGPYECETCPVCGENDMWNGECASCGFIKDDAEDEEVNEDDFWFNKGYDEDDIWDNDDMEGLDEE